MRTLIMKARTARLTLSSAMTLAAEPDSFLATYHAIKDGAVAETDWLRRDGGKIHMQRSDTGKSVRLCTYSYP